MKREADAGPMANCGPPNPHKRFRQGDDELRLLIPSKVCYCKNYLQFNYIIYYYLLQLLLLLLLSQ